MSLRTRARIQAQDVLASSSVSNADLRRLRDHLSAGLMDGGPTGSCFFGILGGCTHEGYVRLREEVHMAPDSPMNNPIEDYCSEIEGHTPAESVRVRAIIGWVDLELARRERASAADQLIAETPARRHIDADMQIPPYSMIEA